MPEMYSKENGHSGGMRIALSKDAAKDAKVNTMEQIFKLSGKDREILNACVEFLAGSDPVDVKKLSDAVEYLRKNNFEDHKSDFL